MTISNRHVWRILVALICLSAGCADSHENLPAYRWIDDTTALGALSSQAHSVKCVSSASSLTLTRADGNSVRLDGAIVMSLADKSVRLRAWKFNHAVFDLTLTPQGLWIETSGDASRKQQTIPASLSAAQLARALAVFGGEFFDGPEAQVIDHGGPRFEVRRTIEGAQVMTADIDRATLAVRQYRMTDSSGTSRFTLALSQYQLINGIPWPMRFVANSDQGKIDVELRETELNTELPPGAFVPPRRAEKLP